VLVLVIVIDLWSSPVKTRVRIGDRSDDPGTLLKLALSNSTVRLVLVLSINANFVNLTCPQRMLLAFSINARMPLGARPVPNVYSFDGWLRLLLLPEGGQGDVLAARTDKRYRDSCQQTLPRRHVDRGGAYFYSGHFSASRSWSN
jgi:hypothetical protein